MKPWIILTVLAVALTASVTVAVPLLSTDDSIHGPEFPAPAKPEGPAPKLVIKEPLIYDFGVIGQYTKGKHQWTFANEGEGVLEVRGSSSSCSCTTYDLFDKPGSNDASSGKLLYIQPGESRLITLNFNTKNFENTYSQYVMLGTNDPTMPSIELRVKGIIKLAIVTVPPESSVGFMNVGNEEPVVRKILVASPDRPETKITGITNSNPVLLDVSMRVATPDDSARYQFEKAYWFDITLKPTSTLGEFNEEIVVDTDHPLRKSQTIKVRGKITGPILLVPERLDIKNATTKDGGSQSVMILARSRPSVNFTVDKKPKGIDIAIEPMPATAGNKGSKYKMTVTLAPGLEPGPLNGEIVLKTDDPKASEIHVPVAVLIQGAL